MGCRRRGWYIYTESKDGNNGGSVNLFYGGYVVMLAGLPTVYMAHEKKEAPNKVLCLRHQGLSKASDSPVSLHLGRPTRISEVEYYYNGSVTYSRFSRFCSVSPLLRM